MIKVKKQISKEFYSHYVLTHSSSHFGETGVCGYVTYLVFFMLNTQLYVQGDKVIKAHSALQINYKFYVIQSVHRLTATDISIYG